MLIRALIVFLAILNLGVAVWWLSRPDAVAPAAPTQPAGVPRLQLLAEKTPVPSPPARPRAEAAPAVPIAAKTGPAATVAPAPAVANRCYALGPFADAPTASAAAVRAGALSTRTREEPGAASAWSVLLPPFADRAAAQAAAQRIGAAGFDDYLVINTGEQVNGIALGRYRNRESAQRRQAALQAAGFAAQLQPVGPAGASKWWADVSVAASASIGQGRPVDCATLR